ncbi:MAG TPA: DUF2199 domain-containing protein [Chloroflexota bacterium]|nr:DUF2199 domain-containing protein [Chloroflexota bacterium]
MAEKVPGYTCHSCGAYHSELPLSYFVPLPDAVLWVPEAERAQRCRILDEVCIIDNEHFFIRGNIEIPIRGQETPFGWTVWTSLSRANFERAVRLWDRPERVDEPPYFGWLNNLLPPYPTTIDLKTHVHTRPVGTRPYIELEPTDHPLAVEQRQGITMARVQEIAEIMLHEQPGAHGRS